MACQDFHINLRFKGERGNDLWARPDLLGWPGERPGHLGLFQHENFGMTNVWKWVGPSRGGCCGEGGAKPPQSLSIEVGPRQAATMSVKLQLARKPGAYIWNIMLPMIVLASMGYLTSAIHVRTVILTRVRVEIMGPGKYEIVGKSQSVLFMINPIISTRTRINAG